MQQVDQSARDGSSFISVGYNKSKQPHTLNQSSLNSAILDEYVDMEHFNTSARQKKKLHNMLNVNIDKLKWTKRKNPKVNLSGMVFTNE